MPWRRSGRRSCAAPRSLKSIRECHDVAPAAPQSVRARAPRRGLAPDGRLASAQPGRGRATAGVPAGDYPNGVAYDPISSRVFVSNNRGVGVAIVDVKAAHALPGVLERRICAARHPMRLRREPGSRERSCGSRLSRRACVLLKLHPWTIHRPYLHSGRPGREWRSSHSWPWRCSFS